MALKLFHCPSCGVTEYRERTYVPVTDRKPYYAGEDRAVPVVCGVLLLPAAPDVLDPQPCTGIMDQVLRGQSHDLLREDFIIDVDGSGPRRVSSLSELRALERHSEQQHRNGEGQILNFREFTQDRNNRERNSFEGSGYQTGKARRPERRKTLSNLPINVRTTQG